MSNGADGRPLCPRCGARLAGQLRTLHATPPVEEYRFAPPRRWRFDFAWPALLLAVEIEGGVWRGGRHTRGAGYYQADAEKYNAAAVAGWTVLRYTSVDVSRWTAAAEVLRVLQSRAAAAEVLRVVQSRAEAAGAAR